MKNLKKERIHKRWLQILGMVIALCLILTNANVHMIFAEDKELTKADLIPASITIDSPKELSKVALPGSSYGTLKWKKGNAVPAVYSSSYEVLFTAAADCTADFSKVEGFDSKTRTLSGNVTVYVKSLAPEPTPTPAVTETPEATATPTPAVTETPEATATPTPAVTETPEATPTPTPAVTETPEETPAPEEDEDKETEKEKIDSLTPSDQKDNQEEHVPTPDEPTPEVTPLPQSPMEIVEEEIRPEDVSEDMTPEEQAAVAAKNHTCQGITVSAEFLPWYVQFRVSDGSGFGFSNSEDASTFRAYEFQLWDLMNDTEYKIPAGESVQVTMPAIEGYEYTIEHIRPDGTTETIIPQVYGGTMVFSTDSFSPFGIAGSKPLVGGDIADNSYGSSSSSGTGNSQSSSSSSSTGSSQSSSSSSSTGSSQSSSSSSSTGSSQSSSSSSSTGSSKSSSSSGSSYTKIVKTGDETNIAPFVIIILAALVVIGGAVYLLNKRRK